MAWCPECKEEYEDKEYPYPLFYGRMRRIQADIAFENENYEIALSGYSRGISEISQHGGYGMYFIEAELANLSKRLESFSQEEALQWIIHLKNYWTDNAAEDKIDVLVDWCDEQIIDSKLLY